MPNIFRRRITRVWEALKEEHVPSALLISSACQAPKSRDTFHPFRQDSDFYYLTGSLSRDLVLLLSSSAKTPLLFAPPPDQKQLLWEGKTTKARRLADQIGADLIVSSGLEKEVINRLNRIECLYFQNRRGTLAWKIAQTLIEKPSHLRGSLPARFCSADLILHELRLYKEPEEVALISRAAEITALALRSALPYIKAGNSEAQLAATLDYCFRLEGAQPAFETIVACGKNGATLHHHPGPAKLRSEDLVLIDCGAQSEMYCADITRVLPVNGRFSQAERELYAIVLEAQLAAIAKIRPGITVQTVHKAAARIITAGLVELKILRGRTSQLLAKQAYKPFFPHSIGHNLGLDVHDVGLVREEGSTVLKAGMVITVEPGLYFRKNLGKFRPCGIRIEDDILVTAAGAKVLSPGFPKDWREIERLLT